MMPRRDNTRRSLIPNVFIRALSYVDSVGMHVLLLLLGEVDASVRKVRVGSESQDRG